MDKEFPDQIHTGAGTTTGGSDGGYHTTHNQGGIFDKIDRAYLRSLPAIIHIVQIILSFLYWVILAAARWYSGFMITVGISAMIETAIFFTVFLFRINEKIQFIAWEMSEFIVNCVVAGCFCLAAILTSVEAGDSRGNTAHGKLVFCTLLAWGLTILYALSVFLSFRVCTAHRQRGGRPSTAATTTTTTTTTVIVENSQQYPAVDPYGPPAYKP